jgi:hypothetical protein
MQWSLLVWVFASCGGVSPVEAGAQGSNKAMILVDITPLQCDEEQ